MGYLRCLPPAAVLASLLVGPVARAEPPQLLPTRDVDITYDVTLPSQPRVRERVRWLAAEQLERVDGPHKSTTIFNRRTHEITLLTSANRTFRQLDMPRQPQEPAPEAFGDGLHLIPQYVGRSDVHRGVKAGRFPSLSLICAQNQIRFTCGS